MTAIKVIKALENLVLMYKSLNQLANKKTEIIKEGNIQALNTLIGEEKKHIQAIQKLENMLIKEASTFLQNKDITNSDITVNECIEHAGKEDKQLLSNKKSELEEQVKRLKNQNDLNQQLLNQSLQFVNMSLDLLIPEIDAFNYDRPNQEREIGENNRSIFDSKA